MRLFVINTGSLTDSAKKEKKRRAVIFYGPSKTAPVGNSSSRTVTLVFFLWHSSWDCLYRLRTDTLISRKATWVEVISFRIIIIITSVIYRRSHIFHYHARHSFAPFAVILTISRLSCYVSFNHTLTYTLSSSFFVIS